MIFRRRHGIERPEGAALRRGLACLRKNFHEGPASVSNCSVVDMHCSQVEHDIHFPRLHTRAKEAASKAHLMKPSDSRSEFCKRKGLVFFCVVNLVALVPRPVELPLLLCRNSKILNEFQNFTSEFLKIKDSTGGRRVGTMATLKVEGFLGELK